MAAVMDAVARRTPAWRLRRVPPAAAQVVVAVLACGRWTGVASPGLRLLSGLDGLVDDSVAICTISGASVAFLKQGDCVVRANHTGRTNDLPAPQTQQAITVLPHV